MGVGGAPRPTNLCSIVPAWNLSTSESAAKTDLEPNFSPFTSPCPSLSLKNEEREMETSFGRRRGRARNKYRDYLFFFFSRWWTSRRLVNAVVFSPSSPFGPRGDDRRGFSRNEMEICGVPLSIKGGERRNAFDRARHDRSMRIYTSRVIESFNASNLLPSFSL